MTDHPLSSSHSDQKFPRQQEIIFSILNMFVIAMFLLANMLLSRYWGPVSMHLFSVLALGFLAHAALLIWIQSRANLITANGIKTWTLISIGLNMALTVTASATSKNDSQYYVLMLVPVLQAAFRFSLPATIAVVGLADFMNFSWIWQYFLLHSPVDVDECLEAGTICFIFTLTGIVVWLLVDSLRKKEATLDRNLAELDRTRQRLFIEEKLAAVGRLSSAIAHEIRNPVAMISSSLSMASGHHLALSDRQEMFDIAAKEALRLEKLTSEFLAYAHPRHPAKTSTNVSDTLNYVANACRAYGAEKEVHMHVDAAEELAADMDGAQIQQALLNLVKNAIDASPAGQPVYLRARNAPGTGVLLEIENSGPAIPSEALGRLFEPFHTTKAVGTGLGLAITRNICRAHAGDITLSSNEPGRVGFTIQLPAGE
jgi:signal transduction histidine kinase